MTDDLIQEMIDPERPQGDAPRRRRLVATIAILALALVGITSLATGAIFTDRETTSGDLLTGTVDLSMGDGIAWVDFPAAGLSPGDVVVSPIEVNNTGSLQLRYAVSFMADGNSTGSRVSTDKAVDERDADAVAGKGDLRTMLTLDVFVVENAGACTKTATLPDAANSGTNNDLVPDTNATLDGYTPILGAATTTPFSSGRTLGATTGTETLCVRVTFDKDADNGFQNTKATIHLRFDAEQTVNNPVT